MAKLTRVTGKVFASEAQAETGGIGQFGSAATGTPNPTTDVATIQALNAYKEGWGSAVVSTRNFPPLEEVNGVLKTISYQACYLLQEGVPTYDSGTTYSNTSIVKTINEYGVLFYHSLQDDNTNHALSDTSWWERMYFQNGYEGDITANRSLTLTGDVTGTVSYNLDTTADNNLSIATSISTSYLQTIYPVGAIYIGTMSTCPLQALFGTWNLIGSGLTLQQANSQYPVKTKIAAGLPNLFGWFIAWTNSRGGTDRADNLLFKWISRSTNSATHNSGEQYASKFEFDASGYNSTFGNSTTVQPPAYSVNIWERTA